MTLLPLQVLGSHGLLGTTEATKYNEVLDLVLLLYIQKLVSTHLVLRVENMHLQR
jgi:hypothetical protein